MVSGTVKNPAGAGGLPGVLVKVMHDATEVGNMTTDAQGHFWISGLQPPGAYTVLPQLSGYKFTGARRCPALPWLQPRFEHRFCLQTTNFPPGCYCVDFIPPRQVDPR